VKKIGEIRYNKREVIMMVYFYKDYVIKEDIKFKGDSKKNLRYLLEVPLTNNTDKSILVIMKNPSLADEYKSDHTINNVLKFCNSKQYSKVYIMNLYAYYSTNPNGVASLIKKNREILAIGNENDRILGQISEKVNDIIVAWGSNTFACTDKYKHRIKKVTQIIEEKNLYYVENTRN
jgi:hypothetical protein